MKVFQNRNYDKTFINLKKEIRKCLLIQNFFKLLSKIISISYLFERSKNFFKLLEKPLIFKFLNNLS